ncbi:hypothetical protein CDAR_605241 [Caerostris darwini]|uniref:Uncharacterized protein n=1 Tax=Caerostris darwini TaxID=1538125 RepID=A0AAV4U8R5_9ARAC|nr:hypothetical protein CDAR_605241 [Caerostris darwini]
MTHNKRHSFIRQSFNNRAIHRELWALDLKDNFSWKQNRHEQNNFVRHPSCIPNILEKRFSASPEAPVNVVDAVAGEKYAVTRSSLLDTQPIVRRSPAGGSRIHRPLHYAREGRFNL